MTETAWYIRFLVEWGGLASWQRRLGYPSEQAV